MKQKSWFYELIRMIIKPFLKLIFRYEVYNKNSIPQEGKFILCSNHISIIDPVLLIVTQKRRICFMAKSELFKNKIFAAILYAMGVFPVNRGKADLNSLNEAENIVNDDRVLGIFLEGTRSKTGEFLKPKPGVAAIAYNTNTPIVPVCITSKDFGRVKPFKKVIVAYGKPITPEDLEVCEGKGTEIRNASRKVMNEIKKLREQTAGAYCVSDCACGGNND